MYAPYNFFMHFRIANKHGEAAKKAAVAIFVDKEFERKADQAFSASNGNPLSCFRWLSSPTSNSPSCFTFVLQATEDSKERLEAAHNHTIGRLSKAVEDKFRLSFSPPVLAAVAKLSLNYIEEAAVDIEAFSRFELNIVIIF